MKFTKDIPIRNFEFWGGAKQNANKLSLEDLDRLEYILESYYPEGMSITEMNDIMWFDFYTVLEWLGYEPEE